MAGANVATAPNRLCFRDFVTYITRGDITL